MTQVQKMTRRRLSLRPKSAKREAELHQTLALLAHQRRLQRRMKSKRLSQLKKLQFQAMTPQTLTHLMKSQRRRLQSRLPQLKTELLQRKLLLNNQTHQMTAILTVMSKYSRNQLLKLLQQRRERRNQTLNLTLMMKAQRKKSQRESNQTSHKERSKPRRKKPKKKTKKKKVEMIQMLTRKNFSLVTWLLPPLKILSEKLSVNTVLLLILKSHNKWASQKVLPLLNLRPIKRLKLLVMPLMVRIWMAETSELTSLVVLHQLEVPVTEVSNKEKDQVVVMELPLLCSSVT